MASASVPFGCEGGLFGTDVIGIEPDGGVVVPPRVVDPEVAYSPAVVVVDPYVTVLAVSEPPQAMLDSRTIDSTRIARTLTFISISPFVSLFHCKRPTVYTEHQEKHYRVAVELSWTDMERQRLRAPKRAQLGTQQNLQFG
jgi:hypothetical protein